MENLKELEKQIKEVQEELIKTKENLQEDKLAMIVYSGDLDKVLASFIIATGAAAMDMEVGMFFTFWGIAALRDPKKVKKDKDFISKMFGWMLPKGSKKLKLSKMNMGGLGTKMIRSVMKKKNVASLEELIEMAKDLGVKIYICQMSMDLMGFSPEEMIDYPNLEYAGVATFLEFAHKSKIQLFI